MRYPYMTPPEGGDPRPELPALVFGPDGEHIVWGLIDPTRTRSSIPVGVGRTIGVVSSSGDGAGRWPEAEIDVAILIDDRHVRWRIAVEFSATDDRARWGLRGFLDRFDILLRGPLATFTLTPAAELPAPRFP